MCKGVENIWRLLGIKSANWKSKEDIDIWLLSEKKIKYT